MYLSADETQGVPILVFDANGDRHGAVKYCNTDTGTICSVYQFCPGVERTYTAPAPLVLINQDTGLPILDELHLALAAAFRSGRIRDKNKWTALKERQDRAFATLAGCLSSWLDHGEH